jgi:hypothetical protein
LNSKAQDVQVSSGILSTQVERNHKKEKKRLRDWDIPYSFRKWYPLRQPLRAEKDAVFHFCPLLASTRPSCQILEDSDSMKCGMGRVERLASSTFLKRCPG